MYDCLVGWIAEFQNQLIRCTSFMVSDISSKTFWAVNLSYLASQWEMTILNRNYIHYRHITFIIKPEYTSSYCYKLPMRRILNYPLKSFTERLLSGCITVIIVFHPRTQPAYRTYQRSMTIFSNKRNRSMLKFSYYNSAIKNLQANIFRKKNRIQIWK